MSHISIYTHTHTHIICKHTQQPTRAGHVKQERWGWPGVVWQMRGEWRSASMGSGGPCVMTSGTDTMPWWSATSLDMEQKVRMHTKATSVTRACMIYTVQDLWQIVVGQSWFMFPDIMRTNNSKSKIYKLLVAGMKRRCEQCQEGK